MPRSIPMLALLIAMLAFSVSAAAQESRPLTNQDVIDMVKGGLAESLILTSVQSAPEEFATGPQDLMQLQDAGVPVSIVQAMIARNSSAAPPAGGAVLPPGYPAMPKPGAGGFMPTYILTPNAPLEPGEYGVVTNRNQVWDFGVD